MKCFALLSLVVAFGLGACERHEFEGPEGTNRLHNQAHPDPHADHSGENAAH